MKFHLLVVDYHHQPVQLTTRYDAEHEKDELAKIDD